MFLFPLVMALSMKMVARWDWVLPLRNGEKRRSGLVLLFLAPLVLLFLAYPIIYLLLIFWAVILAPFMALHRPAPKSTIHADEAGVQLAMIASLVTILAGYCGLLARSLKRFTGVWHGGLFVRLIAWICAPIAVGLLLAPQIRSLGNDPLFSITYFWLFVLWVPSTLVFYKAGAVFGLWLGSSN